MISQADRGWRLSDPTPPSIYDKGHYHIYKAGLRKGFLPTGVGTPAAGRDGKVALMMYDLIIAWAPSPSIFQSGPSGSFELGALPLSGAWSPPGCASAPNFCKKSAQSYQRA